MILFHLKITLVISPMSFEFSFATNCRRSSSNCIFFGRKARCLSPNDSGVEVLK